MQKSNVKQPRNAQYGFSLIEVLVSIVVLSFGLLGMVGMQVMALQSNRDAKLQSAAVRLTKEAAELMRDSKNIAVGKAAPANPFLVSFTGTLPGAASENCFTISCTTPTKIAEFNIKEWLGRVNSELPGARATICYDVSPFDSAGFPQWTCSNSGDLMVVKLGWTRASTDRSSTGAAAFDKAVRPSIVLPATAGAGV